MVLVAIGAESIGPGCTRGGKIFIGCLLGVPGEVEPLGIAALGLGVGGCGKVRLVGTKVQARFRVPVIGRYHLLDGHGSPKIANAEGDRREGTSS
jgi:hypothetical protein